MKRLGELVYTNKSNYKVYAVMTRDESSFRVSVKLYIESPTGEMSKIFTISKRDVYFNKKAFDIFFSLDGSFTMEDITTIKLEVGKLVGSKMGMVNIQDTATTKQLHEAVSSYIRGNKEDLESNTHADCFIKDGYGYMHTSMMEDFLAKNKDLGFKKLEVLEHLKIMGVLYANNNRPYDWAVRQGKEIKRFYKMALAEEKPDESEVEEIGAEHGTESL